jgi:pimeloyl-ACP methyl ester carboxylesterase
MQEGPPMPHLNRDGVNLYYEEAGAGPVMVFVHGWTCDSTHFAPQVTYFSPGHRCISVDLRGHGQSDKPEQAYTIEGFADDVAWMCAQLGVSRAVFSGHSMGGAIVLALAAAHPELCDAIIMLDPAILFPAELQPLIAQLVAAFRSPEGPSVMRQFGADRFFLPTSDTSLKERLLDQMGRTPMHVAASAFEDVGAFDGEAELRGLRVPVLFVEAEPVIDRGAHLRELCRQIVTGKTVGAGHFHQLEVPDQVNAMIERFLAISRVS